MFAVIQGTRQDVDVFHIPSENDNAMLKGVELLLEKGKESEFTSVFISKYVCVRNTKLLLTEN